MVGDSGGDWRISRPRVALDRLEKDTSQRVDLSHSASALVSRHSHRRSAIGELSLRQLQAQAKRGGSVNVLVPVVYIWSNRQLCLVNVVFLYCI